MTLPAIRLIALDIGGTIIEDRGDIPGLMRAALSHHGVPSTPEEIAKLRGASKREMVRYFVDKLPPTSVRDSLISKIFDEFTASVIKVYRGVPPVAGAEDAIRELRDKRYLIAATTGFDRVITTSIFARLGWEKYFAAVVCSDEVAEGRPAPYMLFHAMERARVTSVAEVMAVGDTVLDLHAGTNAGAGAVVGVLTGAGTLDQLKSQPHTHILPSVAALPTLLEK